MLTSAPFVKSRRVIPRWPSLTAPWRGVSRFVSNWFKLAPLALSTSAVSRDPSSAALDSEVLRILFHRGRHVFMKGLQSLPKVCSLIIDWLLFYFIFSFRFNINSVSGHTFANESASKCWLTVQVLKNYVSNGWVFQKKRLPTFTRFFKLLHSRFSIQ